MSADGRCDYLAAVPMPSKSSEQLIIAMDKIILLYLSKGHIVLHFSSDDEANLNATKPELRKRRITHSSTPAGLHEKKAERSIQTIKGRLAAMKAHLPFVLPKYLEAEAVLSIINTSNMVPTSNTGTISPYQAFNGSKPIVPV